MIIRIFWLWKTRLVLSTHRVTPLIGFQVHDITLLNGCGSGKGANRPETVGGQLLERREESVTIVDMLQCFRQKK